MVQYLLEQGSMKEKKQSGGDMLCSRLGSFWNLLERNAECRGDSSTRTSHRNIWGGSWECLGKWKRGALFLFVIYGRIGSSAPYCWHASFCLSPCNQTMLSFSLYLILSVAKKEMDMHVVMYEIICTMNFREIETAFLY